MTLLDTEGSASIPVGYQFFAQRLPQDIDPEDLEAHFNLAAAEVDSHSNPSILAQFFRAGDHSYLLLL